MERRRLIAGVMLAVMCTWLMAAQNVRAAEPIVIGVATSLGFLEGKESIKAVQLAVDEINAAGGVKVGGGTRPFKVESIDLRDAAPGVPVPEALLGLEKIILEKKPTALMVGPFRSEALIAGMDIITKYKVPLLGTIAMAPGSKKKIKEDPQKYKYIRRLIFWSSTKSAISPSASKALISSFRLSAPGIKRNQPLDAWAPAVFHVSLCVNGCAKNAWRLAEGSFTIR